MEESHIPASTPVPPEAEVTAAETAQPVVESTENVPEIKAQSEVAVGNPLTKKRSTSFLGSLENLQLELRPGERLLMYIGAVLLAVGATLLLISVNNAISVDIPAKGGSLHEGILGPARFVNPILAISQADQDMTELVYSGLTRAMPDGSIIPDLATSFDVSEDGRTYTFILRDELTFHDGSKLTSEDVEFTVLLAQNPDAKSPRRADWEGVQISIPDAKTVVFTLPRAYAPFLSNTTIGILPKALWKDAKLEDLQFHTLNTSPIGSGPFKISTVRKDTTGTPNGYDLEPFENFTLGVPHLSHLYISLYPNSEELFSDFKAGRFGALAGISGAELMSDFPDFTGTYVRTVLPRVYGVFYNESRNQVLTDASVREALEIAVDKQALIEGILFGFARKTDSPIPPGILGEQIPATPTPILDLVQSGNATSTPNPERVQAAKDILQKGGWSFDTEKSMWTKEKGKIKLVFSISTIDEPELAALARAASEAWRQAGMVVDTQVYPLSEFNNTILRPREYDMVLFGEVVGRDTDLFAFWHSSQRTDPGLNLALYTNGTTDKILENARANPHKHIRNKAYQEFAEILVKDRPALFLFSPEFIYLVPKNIEGIELGPLTIPGERFANVYQWYTQTESVWSFFSNNHY